MFGALGAETDPILMGSSEMQLDFPGNCDDPWMAAMRRGDLAAAWRISDAVLSERLATGEVCWHRPRHLQFIWTGEPLDDRKVLVRCYHGLGDTIQFLRFMRPLRARAREVSVWVQPALLDLAVSAAGVDRVLPLHDGVPEVTYDADIEIMELPHALRVSAIPCEVPYLFVPPATGVPMQDKVAHKVALRVGIAWRGGDWDLRRSLPMKLLRHIADVSGVELFSLQQGRANRIPWIPTAIGGCDTVGKTAARLAELDLVISIDTMMAHLAGALGMPVWTLLHADCDWRWGEDQSRTVWYPTMRLFRQKRPGDWDSAIEELRDALRMLAANPRLPG
jgi:hypothetical protein